MVCLPHILRHKVALPDEYGTTCSARPLPDSLLSRPVQQGNLRDGVARWRQSSAARTERTSPSFRKWLRRRAQLQFAESASACFERARSFRFSFLCASYMMSARQQKRWIQLDDGVGDTFVLVIVALSDLSRCGPSSPRSLSTRL